MYEPGMVKASNDNCWIKDGIVYLPHSCDEWQVGGQLQVQDLIADLQELLDTEELVKDAFSDHI